MTSPQSHTISDKSLTLDDLEKIYYGDINLSISKSSAEKIIACRNYLDEKIKRSSTPIYGINTGFGSLYDRNISTDNLEKLQNNLVKSHACGVGDHAPDEIVRLMLFLKAQSLAYGKSGVQLVTVQRLVDMFNSGAFPVVYELGSLGASGDLAPLAHLSLPIIGLGEIRLNDKVVNGEKFLANKKWEPIHLQAKEGLALLNGTQFMSAYGVHSVIHAHRLIKLANIISALSLDSFDGRIDPFGDAVNSIRPHIGQMDVARSMQKYLKGSELIVQTKKHVQDPYSFRCIPQVHGATLDTIRHVTNVILTEVNSVTDNPNIFPESDTIVSAGNFHGQPLALAFDFLAIALAELGNISERRTYQLISGSRELPYYLVANPGINSGLMIPQYTAASIVSQNKQLCTPSSIDSIVSSNGQEDHVSMGANAATKLYRIVENIYSILAIELITASQALTFRRPLRTSPLLEKLADNFRTHVPFIEDDRLLHDDIIKAKQFLYKLDLNNV